MIQPSKQTLHISSYTSHR